MEVLGVDTWLFYGHYRLSGYRIVAHEFGHHWGGHNSAWAMSNYGFEAMVDWLNFYFQRRPGSIPGGVSKSMLTLNEAIIDVKKG